MEDQLDNNNHPIPPPRRQRSRENDLESSLSDSTNNLINEQSELRKVSSGNLLQLKKPSNIEVFDKDIKLYSDVKTKNNQSFRPNRRSEICSPLSQNREKIFRRSMSTQSYTPTDLLDKITLEATMLSIFSPSYTPEDASQCNDGSTNVLPNFKLDKTNAKYYHEPIVSENLSNINLYPNEKFHSSNGSSNESQMKDNYLDWTINTFKNMSSKENLETKFSKNTPVNNSIVLNEIEMFIKEQEIDSKDILDLLQYEFGDNIYCQHLPSQDKKLIELLQKAGKHEMLTELNVVEPPLEEETLAKHFLSHEKNLLIPIQKVKIEYTRERRDSAIDELSSWFVRPLNIDEQ